MRNLIIGLLLLAFKKIIKKFIYYSTINQSK